MMNPVCGNLALLLAVIVKVHSQHTQRRIVPGGGQIGDCPLPDVGTLRELIPRTLHSDVNLPTVSISDHIFVCQAAGLRRGTVSSFSAVVTYSCSGVPADCDGNSRTDHFQFDCNLDNTTTLAIVAGGAVRTQDVTFTLDPPRTLEERCGQCIQEGNTLGINSDPNSHCAACPSVCNEGQRRCTNADTETNEVCCNWYVRDRCVVTCPGALQGDMETFDCGCGKLLLENGNITYTNRFLANSVATFSCDTARGYVLSEINTQRTCIMPDNALEAGWSGDQPTCELFNCDASEIEQPENGNVNIQSFTFGSVVTFSCKDNFVLVGEKERTCTFDGWTGNNSACENLCPASATTAILPFVITAFTTAIITALLSTVIFVLAVKYHPKIQHKSAATRGGEDKVRYGNVDRRVEVMAENDPDYMEIIRKEDRKTIMALSRNEAYNIAQTDCRMI